MRRAATVLSLALIGWLLSPHASAQNKLVEAGVPALSREWNGDDYVRAAAVLASGKVPLPRLADSEGENFVRRLTSTDNLALCRNPTLPLEQRMGDYLNILQGADTIVKQYMAATNKGVKVHREVAMQLGFLLRCAAAGTKLVDEFMPAVPRDDKYPVRVNGLKQMNAGLTEIFAGAVTSLSETSFYAPEDLSLMLDAMAETLPSMKKSFAPDYRIELRKRLEADRATFPRPQDARDIQQMLTDLES